MTERTSPIDVYEKSLRDLVQRIKILEDSLQQELGSKIALELELREIKNSSAWLSILKYRGLRDRFLPIGTRRRRCYDHVKGNLRALVSGKDSRFDLPSLDISEPGKQTLSAPEIGYIDYPLASEILPREPLWIRGWTVLSAPLARVDIRMNGQVHGCARLGIYRAELAKLFPNRPDAIVSGFEYLLDITSLSAEGNVLMLGALAHSLDGSCYEPPEVAIRVVYQEPASEYHDGKSAPIRTRIKRSVPKESRTEKEALRLLVFTHHLGYGGGQLYLYELLRQLSSRDDFTAMVVAPDDGPLRTLIEDLGISVHLTCGYPYQNVEMFEGKIDELVAWARPQGFNVALVNTIVALPGPEVAMRIGIPFVWAIHESWKPDILWSVVHPSPGAHPDIRRRVTDALGKAAAVVFEADATRLQYQPYGASERFILVPYGIDLDSIGRYRASFDRATARRRLGIPNTANAILCMSTIEPRKAQVLLVQAFRQLAEAHSDAFLILVGDTGSPYGGALRSYVAAARLQHRVLISPVVAETYEWYASADLLVCPSDVESMPRCVLEAMAFELPVLATEVFGIPELIKDGETGYLCSPCDLAALTVALERVLSEPPEKRREVARNGSALVRTRHDSRGYAEAYLRIMRGLIHDPGANPRDLIAG